MLLPPPSSGSGGEVAQIFRSRGSFELILLIGGVHGGGASTTRFLVFGLTNAPMSAVVAYVWSRSTVFGLFDSKNQRNKED